MFTDPKQLISGCLIFAPGFFAYFIFSQIVDTSNTKDADTLFFFIFLTIVTWIVAYPILNWVGAKLARPIYFLDVDAIGTPIAISTGCLIGLSLAVASEKDLFYGISRSIPVIGDTRKLSRDITIAHLLQKNRHNQIPDNRPKQHAKGIIIAKPIKYFGSYVELVMKDDSELQGWPYRYATERQSSEFDIYLSPACTNQIRGDKKKVTKHNGPGIFVRLGDVKQIHFVDQPRSACFCLWYNALCPIEDDFEY